MISAYVGLPGSGKSYGVWEYVIAPSLKKGLPVWTNIPFNESRCNAEFGNTPIFFTIDQIHENESWFQTVLPKGVVIVIDECWRLWSSGLKATNFVEGHKSFLAEHRHIVGVNGKSTEIYLVTQDLSQIANFARSLIEYTYRAIKLNSVGKSDSFRVDVFSGAVTGQRPSKTLRLRQIFGSYQSKIYNLYDSHTMSETGLSGDETSADDRFNILKDSKLKIYFVLALVLLAFVWWAGSNVLTHYNDDDFAEPLPSDFVPPEAFGLRAESEQVNYAISKSAVFREDVFDGRTPFISFNNGVYPHFDYVIAVRERGTYFEIDLQQIDALGYRIIPISQCLAILETGSTRYQLACKYTDDVSIDVDPLGFVRG